MSGLTTLRLLLLMHFVLSAKWHHARGTDDFGALYDKTASPQTEEPDLRPHITPTVNAEGAREEKDLFDNGDRRPDLLTSPEPDGISSVTDYDYASNEYVTTDGNDLLTPNESLLTVKWNAPDAEESLIQNRTLFENLKRNNLTVIHDEDASGNGNIDSVENIFEDLQENVTNLSSEDVSTIVDVDHIFGSNDDQYTTPTFPDFSTVNTIDFHNLFKPKGPNEYAARNFNSTKESGEEVPSTLTTRQDYFPESSSVPVRLENLEESSEDDPSTTEAYEGPNIESLSGSFGEDSNRMETESSAQDFGGHENILLSQFAYKNRNEIEVGTIKELEDVQMNIQKTPEGRISVEKTELMRNEKPEEYDPASQSEPEDFGLGNIFLNTLQENVLQEKNSVEDEASTPEEEVETTSIHPSIHTSENEGRKGALELTTPVDSDELKSIFWKETGDTGNEDVSSGDGSFSIESEVAKKKIETTTIHSVPITPAAENTEDFEVRTETNLDHELIEINTTDKASINEEDFREREPYTMKFDEETTEKYLKNNLHRKPKILTNFGQGSKGGVENSVNAEENGQQNEKTDVSDLEMHGEYVYTDADISSKNFDEIIDENFLEYGEDNGHLENRSVTENGQVISLQKEKDSPTIATVEHFPHDKSKIEEKQTSDETEVTAEKIDPMSSQYEDETNQVNLELGKSDQVTLLAFPGSTVATLLIEEIANFDEVRTAEDLVENITIKKFESNEETVESSSQTIIESPMTVNENFATEVDSINEDELDRIVMNAINEDTEDKKRPLLTTPVTYGHTDTTFLTEEIANSNTVPTTENLEGVGVKKFKNNEEMGESSSQTTVESSVNESFATEVTPINEDEDKTEFDRSEVANFDEVRTAEDLVENITIKKFQSNEETIESSSQTIIESPMTVNENFATEVDSINEDELDRIVINAINEDTEDKKRPLLTTPVTYGPTDTIFLTEEIANSNTVPTTENLEGVGVKKLKNNEEMGESSSRTIVESSVNESFATELTPVNEDEDKTEFDRSEVANFDEVRTAEDLVENITIKKFESNEETIESSSQTIIETPMTVNENFATEVDSINEDELDRIVINAINEDTEDKKRPLLTTPVTYGHTDTTFLTEEIANSNTVPTTENLEGVGVKKFKNNEEMGESSSQTIVESSVNESFATEVTPINEDEDKTEFDRSEVTIINEDTENEKVHDQMPLLITPVTYGPTDTIFLTEESNEVPTTENLEGAGRKIFKKNETIVETSTLKANHGFATYNSEVEVNSTNEDEEKTEFDRSDITTISEDTENKKVHHDHIPSLTTPVDTIFLTEEIANFNETPTTENMKNVGIKKFEENEEVTESSSQTIVESSTLEANEDFTTYETDPEVHPTNEDKDGSDLDSSDITTINEDTENKKARNQMSLLTTSVDTIYLTDDSNEAPTTENLEDAGIKNFKKNEEMIESSTQTTVEFSTLKANQDFATYKIETEVGPINEDKVETELDIRSDITTTTEDIDNKKILNQMSLFIIPVSYGSTILTEEMANFTVVHTTEYLEDFTTKKLKNKEEIIESTSEIAVDSSTLETTRVFTGYKNRFELNPINEEGYENELEDTENGRIRGHVFSSTTPAGTTTLLIEEVANSKEMQSTDDLEEVSLKKFKVDEDVIESSSETIASTFKLQFTTYKNEFEVNQLKEHEDENELEDTETTPVDYEPAGTTVLIEEITNCNNIQSTDALEYITLKNFKNSEDVIESSSQAIDDLSTLKANQDFMSYKNGFAVSSLNEDKEGNDLEDTGNKKNYDDATLLATPVHPPLTEENGIQTTEKLVKKLTDNEDSSIGETTTSYHTNEYVKKEESENTNESISAEDFDGRNAIRKLKEEEDGKERETDVDLILTATVIPVRYGMMTFRGFASSENESTTSKNIPEKVKVTAEIEDGANFSTVEATTHYTNEYVTKEESSSTNLGISTERFLKEEEEEEIDFILTTTVHYESDFKNIAAGDLKNEDKSKTEQDINAEIVTSSTKNKSETLTTEDEAQTKASRFQNSQDDSATTNVLKFEDLGLTTTLAPITLPGVIIKKYLNEESFSGTVETTEDTRTTDDFKERAFTVKIGLNDVTKDLSTNSGEEMENDSLHETESEEKSSEESFTASHGNEELVFKELSSLKRVMNATANDSEEELVENFSEENFTDLADFSLKNLDNSKSESEDSVETNTREDQKYGNGVSKEAELQTPEEVDEENSADTTEIGSTIKNEDNSNKEKEEESTIASQNYSSTTDAPKEEFSEEKLGKDFSVPTSNSMHNIRDVDWMTTASIDAHGKEAQWMTADDLQEEMTEAIPLKTSVRSDLEAIPLKTSVRSDLEKEESASEPGSSRKALKQDVEVTPNSEVFNEVQVETNGQFLNPQLHLNDESSSEDKKRNENVQLDSPVTYYVESATQELTTGHYQGHPIINDSGKFFGEMSRRIFQKYIDVTTTEKHSVFKGERATERNYVIVEESEEDDDDEWMQTNGFIRKINMPEIHRNLHNQNATEFPVKLASDWEILSDYRHGTNVGGERVIVAQKRGESADNNQRNAEGRTYLNLNLCSILAAADGGNWNCLTSGSLSISFVLGGHTTYVPATARVSGSCDRQNQIIDIDWGINKTADGFLSLRLHNGEMFFWISYVSFRLDLPGKRNEKISVSDLVVLKAEVGDPMQGTINITSVSGLQLLIHVADLTATRTDNCFTKEANVLLQHELAMIVGAAALVTILVLAAAVFLLYKKFRITTSAYKMAIE